MNVVAMRQTRRNMLRGIVLAGSATLASPKAIKQSRASHTGSPTDLEIKSDSRDDGRARYEVWTTGEIKKDGSTEPSDSVYNSGDTHYAAGEINGGGSSDYYEFEGQVIEIYHTRASGSNDTPRLMWYFSKNLDYTGHDCVDVIGFGGDRWGNWNMAEMNCTGSFEKPGDGSLESEDKVDGSYAESHTKNGGHDHFEMNGEFSSIRTRIGDPSSDNPGEIKIERELDCSW